MYLISDLADLIDKSIEYLLLIIDINVNFFLIFIDKFYQFTIKTAKFLEEIEILFENLIINALNTFKMIIILIQNSFESIKEFVHAINLMSKLKTIMLSIVCIVFLLYLIINTIPIVNFIINKRYRRTRNSLCNCNNTSNSIKNNSLEKTIEKFENERLLYTCCICGENLRNILLMPCRHLVMCTQCFNIGYTTTSNTTNTPTNSINKNSKCPICRSYIHYSILIYN